MFTIVEVLPLQAEREGDNRDSPLKERHTHGSGNRPDRGQAGTELQFEEAVRLAKPLFENAAGCHGIELNRSIEHPQIYRLFIQWKTLEHHTVDFRQSEAYTEWRKLVSGFFAAPPVVEHQQVVSID